MIRLVKMSKRKYDNIDEDKINAALDDLLVIEEFEYVNIADITTISMAANGFFIQVRYLG